MRGKAGKKNFCGCTKRITPACAGKSCSKSSIRSKSRDHPRVCGEKSLQKFRLPAGGGSPPRVRGKGSERDYVAALLRITPACAGKRRQRVCYWIEREDHPRVCGEKIKYGTKSSQSVGSPPRVRGKAAATSISVLRQRITPACAGKSNQGTIYRSEHQDHPRVCGEKAPSA